MLTGIDVLAALKRLFLYGKSVHAKDQSFSLRTLWRTVVLARDERLVRAEYANLVEEPAEMEELCPSSADEGRWLNTRGRQLREYPDSPTSERTVFGMHSPKGSQHSSDDLPSHLTPRTARAKSWIRSTGSAAFATTERALVFGAFGQLIEGLVVYTGSCRGHYLNGCLAHLISEFRQILRKLRTPNQTHRGRHFLVLWACQLCALPWRLR